MLSRFAITLALTSALAACARASLDEDASTWNAFQHADASVADAARDASMDAQLRDANVETPARDAAPADASPGPTEAGAAVDARAPDDASLACDQTPCVGHCPLSTVCCSPLGSCGCEFAGLCVLPPLGTN